MKFGRNVFMKELHSTDDMTKWMEEWDKQTFIKRSDDLMSGINTQLMELDIFWDTNTSSITGMNDYSSNLRIQLNEGDEDTKRLYTSLDIIAHIRLLLVDYLDINQILCRFQDGSEGMIRDKIHKLFLALNAKALESRETICSIASYRSSLFNSKEYKIYLNHVSTFDYVGTSLVQFIELVHRLMARYNVEGEVFFGNKEENKILFVPLLQVLKDNKFEKLTAGEFRVHIFNAVNTNTKYSTFLNNISNNASVFNAFIKYNFKVYKEIVNLKAKPILKLILELNDNTNFIEKL